MKSGHSNGSAIYPSLHKRYMSYVYPKYCDYTGGNFPRSNFMLSVWLNFVSRSNILVLIIRQPLNLPDITGRTTGFWEAARSIKQTKFHLKLLIPDRKTAINS